MDAAFFALVPPLAVNTNAPSTTVLAPIADSTMRTNRSSTTVLALTPLAAMLAYACSSAFLALVPTPAVLTYALSSTLPTLALALAMNARWHVVDQLMTDGHVTDGGHGAAPG